MRTADDMKPAHKRALEAVSLGQVEHAYSPFGNAYVAPEGIRESTLRWLASNQHIEDRHMLLGRDERVIYLVMLTGRGKRRLGIDD